MAKFKKLGGNLEIVIEIDENRVGTCTYFLYDRNNHKLQSGVGENSTNIFPIPNDPNDLDGALLMWGAIINANDDHVGQRWFVTMTIRQDGETIEDGYIPHDGTFQAIVATMHDKVRLEAK
jgi:hypothetical protein